MEMKALLLNPFPAAVRDELDEESEIVNAGSLSRYVAGVLAGFSPAQRMEAYARGQATLARAAAARSLEEPSRAAAG